ncbi:MAG: hypothetical protein QM500_10345 [Methylococcales bacterium]
MTEYEVISLIRESVAAINQDFEFFLTATFAVLVTAYAVGDRLGTFPRVMLATLYLASSILFYLRYGALSEQASYYFQLLTDMGSEFPQPDRGLHALLRKLLMILGSLATVYLIFSPTGLVIKDQGSKQDETTT